MLVQTLLPGRELTVGVVGTGPKAQVGRDGGSARPAAEPRVRYANKKNYEGRVWYRLVDDEARR